MRIKGFVYDLARGLRGDADYLEKMIERLARYGFNMLVLQLENRLQFPSRPAIGTTTSLSPSDIQRLDQTAVRLGMDLVPCVNSAGHCEGIGYMEQYRDVVVDPSGSTGGVEQLKVGDPEALRLIRDLYHDLFAMFSSAYVHIGGDEIRWLAMQMPDATEEQRWTKAMEHLTYILELVRSNGKIPMMWGDMLLKYENTISLIPDDVIICDWAYFSAPQLKELSNRKSQHIFKNAGKYAIAAPAVNLFHGNPVLSVNSTLNITSFFADNQSVYEPDGSGVLLCTWENDRGNFFSPAWPWIAMQGALFAGNSVREMEFLQTYTAREWGVDSDELARWYDWIDVQVQKTLLFEATIDENVRKALESKKNRPQLLIRELVIALFRSQNILPVLYGARSWLTSRVRSELREIAVKAEGIASSMLEKAKYRREEPFMLLEWTQVFAAIIDMADALHEAETHYATAARSEFSDQSVHGQALGDCIGAFEKLQRLVDRLVRWSELLVEKENASDEECWWIGQARLDLNQRTKKLTDRSNGNRGMIHFLVFIRLHPDTPFSPLYYRTALKP
ncbi:family 20 glycosylhydrolase [Paenibacillus oceani]|uniref:Family 20 glycosylhydrolase n=1 Tax=Paenibacillus oceani TaxID=2772510 RepID=A0A927CGD1_9BACL|nr:family 20 glycosylhydrolase [Paenibacillus oceani]MBD2865716.1 family 20 glycosylhydrolase [Paenibacillus oceani]